jgi:uncharacterized membrane protein
MDMPQKTLKIKVTYATVIPQSVFIKRKWNQCVREICTVMFITALFMIINKWNHPRWPLTNEWIQKMWGIYIHVYAIECYSTFKKKEILSLWQRGWTRRSLW